MGFGELSNEEKNSIKQELLKEVLRELEQKKQTTLVWSKFKNTELIPFLKTNFDIYDCHKIINALSVFARFKYRKNSSISFSPDEMETVREDVYKLLDYWFGIKREEG